MKKYYFALVLTLFVLPFFAQNIPSYVPKDGLVGYWPFNGNANDESGNGNHGTVNGATLTEDRNGLNNKSYNFNNSRNDIINLPSINCNNITSYSISGWFNKNSNSSGVDGTIFGQSNGCQGSDGLRLYIGTDNLLFWQMEKTNNCISEGKFIPNVNYTDGKWHFFAVIFESNTNSVNCENFKIYIDNILVSQSNINNNNSSIALPLVNNNNTTVFGNVYNNKNNSFPGTLDDIAIYNRALTQQEISALYTSCSSETATSSNFNSLLLSTGSSVSLSAEPQGGVFTGVSIDSNQFVPSKAKIGTNKVQYNFKNSKGCYDSTLFTMIVADTVGTTCKKYDTLTVTKYDTVIVPKTVTKYDTVKVNTYDTITITNNVTKYDTVIVKTNVFDTVKVNTYDTITVTNNVTKYDTVIVKNNIYDTVIVPKTVTKYDTVKVNTYDTITITNNVTKYDTVIVKTNVFDTVKVNTYDTITVTNSVTKYDTVIVNQTKYDTITVTDTVNILKINFKLTTGIKANQMTSMSIYPNPTSDVLIIDASDLAAITGYSYRILDVLGKEVYNALVTTAKTEISLKTIGAKGMYVLHILDANKLSVQTKQIVLE